MRYLDASETSPPACTWLRSPANSRVVSLAVAWFFCASSLGAQQRGPTGLVFSSDFESGNLTEWSMWEPYCFEISVGSRLSPDSSSSYETQVISPILGGPDVDSLRIEVSDAATGSFDLSNENYSTCTRCVLVVADAGAGPTFFQESGTFVVDAASQPLASVLVADLVDVTLIEVAVDPSTSISTPVEGGLCLHLDALSVATPYCGDGIKDSGENCDVGDANGTGGSCCRNDCQWASSQFVCRPAFGPCDLVEYCPGASEVCPVDAWQPDFTPCDINMVCQSGVCVPSDPLCR